MQKMQKNRNNQLMSEHKAVKALIEEQPEGAVKEVLKDALKLVQEIDNLQAEYDAMPKEERESLPESLREFFCDKAA